ncbi:MAG: DUF2220 family protein [Desulfotomaculaceae bacterium]|nr:DUF2220 family protein [Desulfotomaculaceae bacterium]
MKDLIYNYLINPRNNKRIKIKAVEKHVIDKLGLDHYWDKFGGYNTFAEAIEFLVQDGVIQPVKSWKQNGMNPALYNGYQVIIQEDKLDADLIQMLSTQYHPEINVSYYFNHKLEYQQDRVYLSALNNFLKENTALNELRAITVNERSFQIFYDEKWLLSRHGHNFLQRVGLTLEDLRCYPTYEPFFYYQRQHTVGREANVLIVENKDTFFSLKTLMQKGFNSWAKTSFSLLIYGEGRKIEKSFSFFWELEEYKNCKVNFHYFGDLDPEGILIWHELQRRAQVKIRPFVFFYSTLVNKYLNVAQPVKKGQTISKEAIQAFLAYFSAGDADLISKMLNSNLYLPQEGLNYQLLNELAD